jgi:hypothetical protein
MPRTGDPATGDVRIGLSFPRRCPCLTASAPMTTTLYGYRIKARIIPKLWKNARDNGGRRHRGQPRSRCVHFALSRQRNVNTESGYLCRRPYCSSADDGIMVIICNVSMLHRTVCSSCAGGDPLGHTPGQARSSSGRACLALAPGLPCPSRPRLPCPSREVC